MKRSMPVKSGQTVKVLSGKDKGKTGKVIQAFPAMNKVVVDGVNQMVKHLPKRGEQKGDRIEFWGPIHVSNVKVIEDAVEKKAPKKSTKKVEKPDSKKTKKEE